MAEAVGIVDGQTGHRIERAFGIGAETARHLVDGFHHNVATVGIFGQHFGKIRGRRIDRRFGKNLTVGGRRQTRLGKLHGRGIHVFVVRDKGPDAATASGITLRYRIEQHHVVFNTFKVHNGEIRFAVIAKFAIHLIGEQKQIVFLYNLGQGFQLGFGVEITRGVVGIANQDGLGFGRNHLLKFFDGRQGKAVFDFGDDGARNHPGRNGKPVVVGVERLGNDHFVAGVHAGHKGKENAFRTAVGNENFVFGDMNVVFLVVFHQTFAQREIAGRVAVFHQGQFVIAHRVERHVGRNDVGLTDIEVMNFDAAFFGRIGKRHQLPNGGSRHFLCFFRNSRHDSVQMRWKD